MISYFISASLSSLLKKEMGYSNPSTFFNNKTIATVSNEAKEKIRNSLEYSGLMSTGDLVKAFFIWSKELRDSEVHLISFPFLNRPLINFTNSTKFETNLLKKLIFSKKD
jgi:hypothetical protein